MPVQDGQFVGPMWLMESKFDGDVLSYMPAIAHVSPHWMRRLGGHVALFPASRIRMSIREIAWAQA